MTETVTHQDVLKAEPLVHAHLPRTPLYESPSLSKRLGCRFFLKHENHLPTGAFKVRGGINFVGTLPDHERRTGIIGCTTGNHGQSLAFAGNKFGVKVVLVVPQGNNPGKNAAMRCWGAELIEHGHDFDAAREYCERLCVERGLRYVHSANEPKLIAGVGTYALEIFEDLPDPDVILVPIGLGSGVCGTCLVSSALRPETEVIGVQAEAAPAVTLSWRAGTMQTTETAATWAEGMATRVPAEMTMEIMRRHLSDLVLVSEEELREATFLLLKEHRHLVEGAGAASTAAALKLGSRLAGKKVVAVISGGNLDLRELKGLLDRYTVVR